MAKSKLEKRVNRYDTWFDKKRAFFKAIENGADFPELLADYEIRHRSAAVATAYRSWNQSYNQIDIPYSELLQLSDPEIRERNRRLPCPIPENVDLVTAICSMISEQKEFVRLISDNRYQVNELINANRLTQLAAANTMYLFDLADVIASHMYAVILLSEDTEFMVMESDLATKVLKSSNTQISAEDLAHVPFTQLFLEFHKPVTIVDLGDNKKVEAAGVGFHKDAKNNCYSMIWYQDCKELSPEGMPMESFVSLLFCPEANLNRIVLDQPTRNKLGIDADARTLGNRFDGTDAELAEFNALFNRVRDQLLEKSRNIWDFVTCRNVDYTTVKRDEKDHGKIKRYRHLQGKMCLGPRMFKVLHVNKSVKRSEEIKNTGGGTPAFGYREKVPGCFHKWIYCRNCQRTHRHDLIGKPCRRCGKQVGPMSNIEIRKWWHDEYWRGEGEEREVIREIQE